MKSGVLGRPLQLILVLFVVISIASIGWLFNGLIIPSEVFEKFLPNTLSGRVIDVETGEGLAGVSLVVEATGWDYLCPLTALMPEGRSYEGDTDALGRFVIRYRRHVGETRVTVRASGYPRGRTQKLDDGRVEFLMTPVSDTEGRAMELHLSLSSPNDSSWQTSGPLESDVDLDHLRQTTIADSAEIHISLGTKEHPVIALEGNSGAEVLLVPLPPEHWEGWSPSVDCLAPASGYAPSTAVAGVHVANGFIRWNGGRKHARIELRITPMMRSQRPPGSWQRIYLAWVNGSGGRNLCSERPTVLMRF